MVKKLISVLMYGVGAVVAVFLVSLAVIISWLLICGLTYLVTLIFGWAFSWLVSSAIWGAIVIVGIAAMPRKPKKTEK